jgi:radical SAM protein with 4Fe4S-binding SPASM domain
VRSRELADAYRNSEVFRALRDTELLEGRCGRCEYRRICGGSRSRAFALTGNLFATDPWCVYEPQGAGGPRPQEGSPCPIG